MFSSLTRGSSNEDSRGRFRPCLEALEDRLTPAATNADFVAGAVQTILHREFQASTDQRYVDALNSGSSTTLDVASQIVMSDEGVQAEVTDLYRTILGRDPDQGGANFFFSLLKGGLSHQSAKAIMFASDEYFTVFGGGTNQGFLNALYGDQVGRAVDSVGSQVFGGQLNGGARRDAVAIQVINSFEGAQKETRVLFDNLLERAPEALGFNYFSGLLSLTPPTPEQSLVAQIVGSQEFFNRG